jgi:thiol-disulfide isomerase/thioredoxin
VFPDAGPGFHNAEAKVGIVKSSSMNRILHGLLTLMVLCVLVRADTRGPAPQFTAQTLDGETFSNASLSGRVTLLQFWTTWCPVCRGDQSAVDNIESMFAGQGLVVLAIDVGESEATVKTYLQGNPRSCRVVVNDGRSLAARFGVHGYPHYVLIDSQGNIAGTQSGGGGEASLQRLLRRAGLSLQSDKPEVGNQKLAASPGVGRSALIEAPGGPSALPAKPAPKTIFVFANGERLEADHYTLGPTLLHVTVDGLQRTIALSALDIKTTIAVNRERGIDLKFPKTRSEVYVTF